MGTLYILSTPIGNLKDISFRALEILKDVDYVLCEDTRVTGKLLGHFVIKQNLASFTDFSEVEKIPKVIDDLKSGKNIALVSDAGTPLVSDPGFKLVREAVNEEIKVESVPGACAAIAALTVSGLPTDKFMFVGYPPKKEGKRKEFFEKIKASREIISSSIIVYESPYRMIKTLDTIRSVFGDIDIVVCRELTKMHQEIRREKISESIRHFSSIASKGEFVIVF